MFGLVTFVAARLGASTFNHSRNSWSRSDMGVQKVRPEITEPHYLRIEREDDRYIISDDTQPVGHIASQALHEIVLPGRVVEAIKERC